MLNIWYRQPLGCELTLFEKAQLKRLGKKIAVQSILQLGTVPALEALATWRIPRHVWLNSQPCPASSSLSVRPCVVANYTALPFQHELFNAVILPHIFEFAGVDYLNILQETWRVLSPEGYLIVLGFNPWSLWGLHRLYARLQKNNRAPWDNPFISAQHLCRQVIPLGGSVVLSKSFFFRPPWNSTSFLAKTRWLEQAAELVLPEMGGAYVLVLQKHITARIGLTCRLRWQPHWKLTSAVGRVSLH